MHFTLNVNYKHHVLQIEKIHEEVVKTQNTTSDQKIHESLTLYFSILHSLKFLQASTMLSAIVVVVIISNLLHAILNYTY